MPRQRKLQYIENGIGGGHGDDSQAGCMSLRKIFWYQKAHRSRTDQEILMGAILRRTIYASRCIASYHVARCEIGVVTCLEDPSAKVVSRRGGLDSEQRCMLQVCWIDARVENFNENLAGRWLEELCRFFNAEIAVIADPDS